MHKAPKSPSPESPLIRRMRVGARSCREGNVVPRDRGPIKYAFTGGLIDQELIDGRVTYADEIVQSERIKPANVDGYRPS
jgi:hypothetical protein